MHTATQVRVPIVDSSSVSEARRCAATLATTLGLDEAARGELALGITEAGSNIVKHAGRGEILIRCLAADGAAGMEVIALDRGPGISNLAQSLRDGHSTAGSPGTGLGAMQRMTSSFEIYSGRDRGTIVRFEVWMRGARPARPGVGVVCLPKSGEDACGDDWVLVEQSERRIMFVADGLGHGPEAAAAARAAVAAVARCADRAPAEMLSAVDDALRSTRGAAAAVAVIQPGQGVCTFCGVGNIAGSVHANGAVRSMVSHNGILGHQVRKLQEFQYPVPKGGLCVLHSDGLATRWSLSAYPGLETRHPAFIAAALYRDHARGRDDVTVLALRH